MARTTCRHCHRPTSRHSSYCYYCGDTWRKYSELTWIAARLAPIVAGGLVLARAIDRPALLATAPAALRPVWMLMGLSLLGLVGLLASSLARAARDAEVPSAQTVGAWLERRRA